MPEKLIISPEVDQIRIDLKGVELRESWRMNMDYTPIKWVLARLSFIIFLFAQNQEQ